MTDKLEVRSPATGDVVGVHAVADAADVDTAVAAARDWSTWWADIDFGNRKQILDQWRGVLAARLMRRAKDLGAALEDAGPLYVPERLHNVRIATKKLRYALEIARDAGVTAATPLVKLLKRHQERLGHLHLEVLGRDQIDGVERGDDVFRADDDEAVIG